MREGIPKQPSKLDPIDRDSLAILGHRIERWDILKDESIPLDERRSRLADDIEREVDSLMRMREEDEQNQERLDAQIDELLEDIDELESRELSQKEFDELHAERVEYYREVRRIFLENMDK